MNAVKRKADAEVRNLVLIADGSRRRVQIGARSAQIRHDALGGEGFQARDGFSRIRLIVQHDHFDLQLLAANRHAARGVDLLHGDLVAGFDLAAKRSVPSGQRNHRADFDGLADDLGTEAKKRNDCRQ